MKRTRDSQARRDASRSRILARQLADDVLRAVSGGCTKIYPNDGPPRSDFHEI